MKLLDIPPNYLNKELALKICSNKELKKDYILKYNEQFGGQYVESNIKRIYNESFKKIFDKIFKNIALHNKSGNLDLTYDTLA